MMAEVARLWKETPEEPGAIRLHDVAGPVLLSVGVQISQRQSGAASTLWHRVCTKSPVSLLCVSEGSSIFAVNSSTSS